MSRVYNMWKLNIVFFINLVLCHSRRISELYKYIETLYGLRLYSTINKTINNNN